MRVACSAVKPVCPLAGDSFTEPTANRALRTNEALKVQCGAKWAACPKGPPAPMPKPSQTPLPQVEAKTS